MSSQPQDSSARASKLAGFLRHVLGGTRKIQTAADAKLFFEAVRSRTTPSSCIEGLVASKHGVEAMHLAVRVDQSPVFIKSQTLPFIDYLADDQLKLLANGQILQQTLVAIANPPSLWNSLVTFIRTSGLDGEELRIFSWLCLALLSLPKSAEVDVQNDVEAVTHGGLLLKTSCPETRRLGYKIQRLLQLRKSPTAASEDSYCPGGRHDNDHVNFRAIAVYPTTDEFLSTERPFYRRAKEVFNMDVAERPAAHLDNIFRLTREDLLGELRSDWQNAQVRNKRGNTRSAALTLHGLRPVSLDLGDGDRRRKKCTLAVATYGGSVAWKLDKIPKHKRKKWLNDNHNFLRHQAFGALHQGSQIFGFAFVDRDVDALLESPPVVVLRFTDDRVLKKALLAFKTARDVMFTLVGTPVFAYEPVLERLKDMTELPLQDKLLDPSNVIDDDDFVPAPELQPFINKLAAGSEDIQIRIVNGAKRTTRSLDLSQQKSLKSALASKVSVIQGPPGTGKSFIGALTAHYVLQSSDARILVITYTNHALDQFLEDLLDLGISAESMVRLGSKSTNRTAPLLLSNQPREYRLGRNDWAMIDRLKEEAGEYELKLKKAFSKCFGAQKNLAFHDYKEYLEFSEDSMFLEAFLVPTQKDGFTMKGKKGKNIKPSYLFDNWSNGHGPGVFKQQALSQHAEVWNMDHSQRAKLLGKWSLAILDEKAEHIRQLAKEFDRLQDQLDMQFGESQAKCVQSKRIIGCTTTAAAKYTRLLAAAQTSVVLVEEAGEIQESHNLTALTPAVAQLVLIGDHMQLRPKINNYALTVERGAGFDLNRSLFERLILQGHPHTTLRKQHRMHPDISVLVRELTYPDLEDGPGTKEGRAPMRGLEDRVVFINHSRPEVANEQIADRRDEGAKSSKENIYEAEMVLKTVRYLAQQGYTTKNMVVLTPYLGQLRLVRDMLQYEVDPWLSDLDSFELVNAGLMTQAAANVDKSPLRISTIDNYQGEEADIVIVSLTRSNSNGDIGFLAARERLNVLLSRARDCLIMIGNMDTYMSSKKGKDTWVPFFESMKAKNHLFDGLPVACPKHPDKRFLLKEPADFDRCCPDGGCSEECGAALNCGLHNCAMRCHRVEDHTKVHCQQKVDKACDRGHKVKVACHNRNDKCPKCVKEDIETERRIKRDLKLEEDRVAREASYRRELQEIQDEIEHQRRIIKYKKDEEDQKTTLLQQRADLENLKETAERVLKAKTPPKEQQQDPSHAPIAPPSSSSGGSGDSLGSLPEGAKQEWEHMKQFEGAKSQPLDQLMDMIGLEEVKECFLGIKERVDTALRQGISLGKERFNCSMLGNPGTGKTTVARLYAGFLTSIGVIPGSCFKEMTGAGLSNVGVGGCKQLIDDMLNDGGGVLFIDEAYQLATAVLDYLLPEVENLTGKIVFVVAGYRKQMESFFAHNPGLPSRFPVDMPFADYTDDELLRILELNIWKRYDGRMRCEDGARGLYCRIVARRIGRGRGREGFGNARTVENWLAKVAMRQSRRLGAERRGRAGGSGTPSDDLLLTKEDLIGPEPAGALQQSAAWQKLCGLVGLQAVKDAVGALVDSVQQNYQRELAEQPPIEYSLNKVFLGNPGTGKTTVAKLYGSILVDLGMLSKNEVVVKNPSDFVGSALGQSEQLTKGILAASLGKVLVIDEAYGLYGGGNKGGGNGDIYKTAVIDTIVAEVQSVPGDDRCVLLLGYKDQMEDMLQNVNPGLARRFPLSSAFYFDDFNDDELRLILDLKLRQQGFAATDQARRVAMEMLNRARNRPHFGNAGECDILLDAAKARHQRRRSSAVSTTLEARDFDEDFDRADRADTDVAKLFEGTVGNEEVISRLLEYQENVRTMKSLDMDPKENIPFNFLFKGPPGTGKTTTAKKMGKVFYDLGFLSTAEVVECSATDLIGQYVGQTGPKVQQQLDKALGRVLFIDEAYRLAQGPFAKEAMDELVDAVTKDKYAKKLLIILAGYEADINMLMASNSGLTSRFPETINFRSLTPAECVRLLTQELKAHQASLKAKKNLNFDISVLESLPEDAELMHLFSELAKQESWASARDVKEVGKLVFRKVVKDTAGIAQGRLTLDMDLVKAQLLGMLQERINRGTNVSSSSLALRPLLEQLPPVPPQLPPPCCTEGPRVATSTSTKQVTAESPPKDDEEGPEQAAEVVHAAAPPKKQQQAAVRDTGVSDDVWEQLQQDKEAAEQREREYQELVAKVAQKAAQDSAREELVRKLLEEERRRKMEAEAQQKLAAMRACPMGFAWTKQAGGYRCEGGSHFVSDNQLEGQ